MPFLYFVCLYFSFGKFKKVSCFGRVAPNGVAPVKKPAGGRLNYSEPRANSWLCCCPVAGWWGYRRF